MKKIVITLYLNFIFSMPPKRLQYQSKKDDKKPSKTIYNQIKTPATTSERRQTLVNNTDLEENKCTNKSPSKQINNERIAVNNVLKTNLHQIIESSTHNTMLVEKSRIKKIEKKSINDRDTENGKQDKKQTEKGQKFNDEWLNDQSNTYEPWIEKIEDQLTYCKCKWCNKKFKIESMYGARGHCAIKMHTD